MTVALGDAVAARLATWEEERVAERLWERDGSLWEASGKAAEEIAAWLGWLDLPDETGGRIDELGHVARDVRADGYRRAAVLGMGGSSLAPDLFAHLFAGPDGAPHGDGLELRILDSTHPDVVRGFRSWATAARTLFCVSSKSGSTTEPNAFHAAMAAEVPALDFVAITDPGSSLAELARAQEFRAIFDGPPDVGGRYSALSAFGLVPAALAGVDLEVLLDRARGMAEACRRPALDNPGLALGAAIAEAARSGADKLTLLTSDRLAPLGDWIEQLVAESTGKAGTGIIPVVREPIGEASAYGADRYFVFLSLAGDRGALGAVAGELMDRGHQGQHIELADPYDVGAEFVRWEVATAAAGPAALGDEPVTVDGAVRQLLGQLGEGDYLAILAYLPQEPELERRLGALRGRIRDSLGVATTLGFGPRFLHSTGQLHKGGPDSGVFLQLTADPSRDLPIPGWDQTFGTLIAAQALGDMGSLQRRGRRALRLHGAEAGDLVTRLEAMIEASLGSS